MIDEIREAMAAGRADYIEVRVQRASASSVHYTGKELENIGRRTRLGGSVRAMVQGGWGFSSFNEVADLPDFVRATCEQARLVERESPGLAPVEPKTDSVVAEPEVDPRDVPLEDKQALCERYNDIILSAPKIQTSTVLYRDSTVDEYLVTSDGAELHQETCFAGTMVMAVAKDGTNIQRAYDSVGDVRGYQIVVDREDVCEAVVQRATDLLTADRPDAGPHTVVLDPKLCGVFIHEAFGHLSEADFVYENDRLRKIMELGRRFGPDALSICDHPRMPGEAGYYAYDAEAVAGDKTHLIRDGVLKSRLHSRETARMMDEAPTGNARCLNYSFAPIVRMSNTYMEPREHSFEELLAGVDDGIYAIGAIGGQTDMEMFTFSAEEGYEIKDGKLGKKLRDVVLTGNVFQTLQDIERIGDDFQMYGGLGGCGKGGQMPLRVGDGGPSVRIKNVVVGGQ
ncbi:MAG: TldD/PmbA family protein [Planctomycetota bacterium]